MKEPLIPLDLIDLEAAKRAFLGGAHYSEAALAEKIVSGEIPAAEISLITTSESVSEQVDAEALLAFLQNPGF